jgi:phospholipid/cholesterol/gamma-HCH transport system substrate-binding protein
VSRYLKIGLFVTITGTALIVYVMQTAEVVGTGQTYTVHAFIDDASGLLVDSDVSIAGVDVGRLTAIQLEGDRARLTMEIRRGVELTEDAEVVKATEGLLGTASVSINPAQGQGAAVSDGETLRNVRRSATISQTVESANDLASNATELVQEINTYLRDQQTVQAIDEIVQVTREMVTSTRVLLEENLVLARASMENIQAFTDRMDAQTEGQFMRVREILESTASLTARLDGLVGAGDESLERSIRGIEDNLDSLQRVLDSVEVSASNVQSITGTISDGEGNVGRLVNDDELYDRTVQVVEQAQEFLDATIGLGVQVGFTSEYLTQQVDTKDEFELRLVPGDGDTKYYSVGVVNTPVPTRTVRTTRTTTTPTGTNAGSVPVPENTVTTEEVTTDEFKLNLQLARIWGPLTVRAGVFESTAGVGMDLAPIDQFSLSAEAFDFGAEDGVYLRGFGTIYPFFDPAGNNPLDWLYLSGGVDDAMGVYERDFFVGAGVRFTDEDLRGLVGFIPIN